MDRGGQRGWSALVGTAGVLMCAGVASANGAAAIGPYGDPRYGLLILGVVIVIETIVLLCFGAKKSIKTLGLVLGANVLSYAVGGIISMLTSRQSFASLPVGMDWWGTLPYVILFTSLLLTLALEWPILRFAFAKSQRLLSVGAILTAHVLSYSCLAFGFSMSVDTSLVTDLRIERDAALLKPAGDAIFVFFDEEGTLRQTRAPQLGTSIPVTVKGERVRVSGLISRHGIGFIAGDGGPTAIRSVEWLHRRAVDVEPQWSVPISVNRTSYLRHVGTGEDQGWGWDDGVLLGLRGFTDWRSQPAPEEWIEPTIDGGMALGRADGYDWSHHYAYTLTPWFYTRCNQVHILPGDIAICSIEPGYPIAIAWNDGWVMDLREVLGARSDVVVVYGEVGDGWPEDESNSDE